MDAARPPRLGDADIPNFAEASTPQMAGGRGGSPKPAARRGIRIDLEIAPPGKLIAA